MKDYFGTQLKIGDTVVFAKVQNLTTGPRYKGLTKGIITKEHIAFGQTRLTIVCDSGCEVVKEDSSVCKIIYKKEEK